MIAYSSQRDKRMPKAKNSEQSSIDIKDTKRQVKGKVGKSLRGFPKEPLNNVIVVWRSYNTQTTQGDWL
jgi:hypothetical protein